MKHIPETSTSDTRPQENHPIDTGPKNATRIPHRVHCPPTGCKKKASATDNKRRNGISVDALHHSHVDFFPSLLSSAKFEAKRLVPASNITRGTLRGAQATQTHPRDVHRQGAPRPSETLVRNLRLSSLSKLRGLHARGGRNMKQRADEAHSRNEH